MDINHETYNTDLRKIAFVLSFMATGSAATWKMQFIEEAYSSNMENAIYRRGLC
jgi:hypothetical protein